jgi:hypothetical protein
VTDLFESKPASPLEPTFAELSEKMNLGELRRNHTAGLKDGIECALCGRFDKIYRRPLNSGMAWALIALYKLDKKKAGWHHLLDEVPGLKGGDYGKLAEWGMIQGRDEAKEDGNPENGFYRITAKGQFFVQGKLRVPKYRYFYHDRLWPVDEGENSETVSIQDALGKHFDYNELMAGVEL